MKSTGKRTVTRAHTERKLNPDTVGGRIWKRREELEMTRDELAQKLSDVAAKLDSEFEFDFQRLWRVETNQTRVVADELPIYAKALKTSVEALVP